MNKIAGLLCSLFLTQTALSQQVTPFGSGTQLRFKLLCNGSDGSQLLFNPLQLKRPSRLPPFDDGVVIFANSKKSTTLDFVGSDVGVTAHRWVYNMAWGDQLIITESLDSGSGQCTRVSCDQLSQTITKAIITTSQGKNFVYNCSFAE